MNEWGWEEDKWEGILFYILNEFCKLPKTRVTESPRLIFCSCCTVSSAGQEVQASQLCSIRPSGCYPSDFPGQLLKRNSICDPQQMGVKTWNIQKGPYEVFCSFSGSREEGLYHFKYCLFWSGSPKSSCGGVLSIHRGGELSVWTSGECLLCSLWDGSVS